jgi:hypothetical protein
VSFSNATLSILVLIALGLAIPSALLVLGSTSRRRRPAREAMPADEAVGALLARIERLDKAVRSLHATDKRQQHQIESGVRRVALIRYDAFEDVGGQLSFSAALLDEHGSGLVLTSINGRQETRVYAKPVAEGTSTYNLSLEEEEAIRRAMADDPQAVEAR